MLCGALHAVRPGIQRHIEPPALLSRRRGVLHHAVGAMTPHLCACLCACVRACVSACVSACMPPCVRAYWAGDGGQHWWHGVGCVLVCAHAGAVVGQCRAWQRRCTGYRPQGARAQDLRHVPWILWRARTKGTRPLPASPRAQDKHRHKHTYPGTRTHPHTRSRTHVRCRERSSQRHTQTHTCVRVHALLSYAAGDIDTLGDCRRTLARQRGRRSLRRCGRALGRAQSVPPVPEYPSTQRTLKYPKFPPSVPKTNA